MKIKDYSNYHIQFMFGYASSPDDVREIWWRIRPSELGWWDRLFHNPWRTIYRECVGDMLMYHSPSVWKEELSHLKTYKDITEWQRKQYREQRKYYQSKVEQGEYWPK